MIDISILEKGHKVDEDYARGIVESHYYQMMAETGALGYYSFLAIMAWSLIIGAIKQLTNGDLIIRSFMIGITFGLFGNYFQSRIEHTLVNYTNMYLWMTYCGILSAAPWYSKSEKALAKLQQSSDAAAEPSGTSQPQPLDLPEKEEDAFPFVTKPFWT